MPNFQLGPLYDVYSHAVHRELLYVEPLFYILDCDAVLGDYHVEISGKIVGRLQSSLAVRPLSGPYLSYQTAKVF